MTGKKFLQWRYQAEMPGGRRGLVAPQNTFLENIIRRSNSQRKKFFLKLLKIKITKKYFDWPKMATTILFLQHYLRTEIFKSSEMRF